MVSVKAMSEGQICSQVKERYLYTVRGVLGRSPSTAQKDKILQVRTKVGLLEKSCCEGREKGRVYLFYVQNVIQIRSLVRWMIFPTIEIHGASPSLDRNLPVSSWMSNPHQGPH
jgi:hypothetical protein